MIDYGINECKCLAPLIDLTEKDVLGWCKRLSIVSYKNKIYYHIGIWDGDGNLKKTGMLLTEVEMKKLRKELEKETKDVELDKFQKDYMQQSHNGPMQDRDKEVLK